MPAQSMPNRSVPMQNAPRSYERVAPPAPSRSEYQRPGGYEQRPVERPASQPRPSMGSQGGEPAAPRAGGHTDARPAPSAGIARSPRGR
jgi:hypothetical protein